MSRHDCRGSVRLGYLSMIYASFGAFILLSVGFTAGTPELVEEPTDEDVLDSVEMDRDPYMLLGKYDLHVYLTDSTARNASEVRIEEADGEIVFQESLEESETAVEWTSPSVGDYNLTVEKNSGKELEYNFTVTNQIHDLIP